MSPSSTDGVVSFDAPNNLPDDADLAFALEMEVWPDDAVIAKPADWERRRRVIAVARVRELHTLRANRRAANGLKNGQFGHLAVEVLRHLATSIDDTSDPDSARPRAVAEAIGRSRSSVVSVFALLRSYGLLDWLPDAR